MKTRKMTRILREGEYIAEVEVNLIDTDEGSTDSAARYGGSVQ